MTAETRDKKLLLTYRKKDTKLGVTRTTAKRLADALDMNETQMIQFAIAHLAQEILPAYEPDDGPLTDEEMAAIRQGAPQDRPFTPTKSLF